MGELPQSVQCYIQVYTLLLWQFVWHVAVPGQHLPQWYLTAHHDTVQAADEEAW